jgi:sugar phosphate permease
MSRNVYSPLLTALMAALAGRQAAGSAIGVTNAFRQIGTLLVPLAVGLVFQLTGSFLAAFAALACGALLGIVALSPSRNRGSTSRPLSRGHQKNRRVRRNGDERQV